MLMQAVVIEVQWNRLLVLDLDTRQNVIVNTQDARRFSPGELVNIWYNGVMTRSIPPQITALGIVSVSQGEMPPFLPPGVRPCPNCPPGFRPPVILPPIIVPPVVRPPRPPVRPPVGPRPPVGSRPPMRPGPGPRPR